MNDSRKTKAQLIEELKSLRKQLIAKTSPSKAKTGTKNIKNTKEYLEAVIKTSYNGIIVLDAEGKFEFGNKSFYQIVGWPKKELIGEYFMKIIPDELTEFMQGKWQEVQVGKGKSYETEILTKKGRRRQLYVKYNDMAFAGQRKYCVVVTDITERKRAEEALSDSEERFRAAFESARDCILIWDKDYNYLYANQAAIDHVGTTRKKVIGKNIRDGLGHVPDFMKLWMNRIDRVFETGESFSVQDETVMQGQLYFTESVLAPIRSADGNVSAVCVVYRDVTERKRVEEQLHERDKNLSQLIETIPDGLGVVDPQGVITFVNKAFMEILGYSKKYILGKHVSALFDDEGFARYKKQLVERKKGIAETYDADLRHIDGYMVPVVVRPSALFDDEGNFKGSFGIFTNLTDQKKMQTELENIYYNIPIGISLVDTDLRYIRINKPLADMNGSPVSDHIGRTVGEMIPDMEDSVIPIYRQVIKSGSAALNIEIEGMTKADPENKHYWSTSYLPLKSDAGIVEGVIAVVEEVTERRTARNAIKNLFDFENLITEVSTSFINLPVERTDTGINIALGILSKFLKIDRSSIVLFSDNLSIANVLYEWCGDGIASRRDKLKDFSTKDFRWWITRLKKGEPIYMHSLDEFPQNAGVEKRFFESAKVKSYVTVPIFFNKELIGFMNFYSIKTTKTWDQETIALLKIVAEIFVNTIMRSRSQRELREYDAKMFRTEQLASLGIISANIAHELNQPLTVIQLLLQQVSRSLTKKSGNTAAVKENIDDSLSELTRAAEIVARFRTFARQSSPDSIEMIDVCKIADSLVKALSSGARKTVMKLSLKKPNKAVYLRATAADFEQLFFVLIQNSIQAADPKAKNHLNINISCKKNKIMLDFKDNCGGVPQESAEKIFEPFFTTKPRQEGTGLGLPILERIVSRYEGTIKVNNIPGYGISFHISLPMGE